jgi:phosphoglycolate phosphatase-like HAD superfamily hydrolase
VARLTDQAARSAAKGTLLIIFDIDGTLTRTFDVDAALYAQAFFDTFGFPLPTLDWTAYSHTTDRGIAEEALRRAGRAASPTILDAMRRRFIDSLDRALMPDPVHQVPGASVMLDRLREDGCAVAFATGCWEASARLKLSRSFIEIGDCLLVACDEEPDRVAILGSAMKRAASDEGPVVYVGDGAWDVQAAKSLQLPFVGIDHDNRGTLRGLGVGSILSDFRDYGAFLAAVRVSAAMTARTP